MTSFQFNRHRVMTDSIHRFIFEDYNIRGELVKLQESVQEMVAGHQYPKIIAELLQQAAAVNALLATTLKFEGKLSIQLQSQGALKVLSVQTNHQLEFRGIVRFDEKTDYSDTTFKELTESGQLFITIEPNKGKRYQGIVSLEGDSLAQCIEDYFNQSEQLKTRMWLFNDGQQVLGLMLQALPDMDSEESFQHLEHLASTLTAEECFSVDSDVLLHRLFHQETISNLSVDAIRFNCGCSQDKMLNALSLIKEEELKHIFEEKDEVSVTCEFCLSQYAFSELAIKKHQAVEGNSTSH